MLETQVTINNKAGLHARPASLLVKTASQYKSKILLVGDGLEVDAKSIMGIMAMGATKGTQLTLKVEGEDAEAALKALIELFQSNFNEE